MKYTFWWNNSTKGLGVFALTEIADVRMNNVQVIFNDVHKYSSAFLAFIGKYLIHHL